MPHPLRQAQTIDYPVRQSSSASSSSGCSFWPSEVLERPSTTSSLSSIQSGNSSYLGHGRGRSEVLDRTSRSSESSIARIRQPMSPENTANIYSTARQSLRRLSQAPTLSPGSVSNPPSPTKSHTINEPRQHARGQSLDLGRVSVRENEAWSPSSVSSLAVGSMRTNAMVSTRCDSIGRDAPAPGAHPVHVAPLATPDLEKLGKSSTNQLRTLSKLAAETGSAGEFAITSPAQEVAGLRGRRRLQRADKKPGARPGQRSGGYGWDGRNWMDTQRQFLQAYEYLCHIGEAKEWIEDIMHRPLPPIVELEETLRDGVTLAEVVEALNAERKYRIFRHARLQYRHSDNINIFFRYLDEVELPDLFRFELIDLYDKKNLPKVIYCIHALSWLLFRKGIVGFRIGNLVGQLEFAHHELEAMQKGLDKLGANMPSFGNMGADFGVEPASPEPEEREEERMERELGNCEGVVLELQAQARGALQRLRLGQVMQRLWAWEESLVGLQARIRGDFTRQVTNYRLDMRRCAIGLQSAARGFLGRTRQLQRHELWQSREREIVALQSLLRAHQVRHAAREERWRLVEAAGSVRAIEAATRGFLARAAAACQRRQGERARGSVALVQATIRGFLVRRGGRADDRRLAEQAGAVARLQAAARAVLMRERVERQKEALCSLEPCWQAVQAACRAKLTRTRLAGLRTGLGSHVPATASLQAAARAAAVRRDAARTRDGLARSGGGVIQLQARICGMLGRVRISNDLDALAHQTDPIVRLQSRIRRHLLGKRLGGLVEALASSSREVVAVQSLVRAMSLRCDVGDLLERLETHEPAITALEAAAKAFAVRASFAAKKRFFDAHMQKVVKIQSLVRAKLQGEAYKSLTTGKNPPVQAVKNFVHLLNDSDFDFNEELEFERLRKMVVQQVRQNETLEQYIDQLDIKIALLVKNKITLDEVVRHQNSMGSHASSLLLQQHNSALASANQFDLKALNKSSRKKLESYQQLFFILQTQPQYLARLFQRVRLLGTAEKECRRIEHLMMGLFGYAQKRREEYYLLKLIGRSVWEEVDASSTVQEYLRGHFFWTRLLAAYTRSPRDRKYLRDLLGPLVRDNIVQDPDLDLESDPMQIYRSAINNEELRTGRPSKRPLDIPRELAIKDAETRELFIDHLRDLREICDQFLAALERLVPRMPYGLRLVCRHLFEALCGRFTREPQHHVLQLVGSWAWRFYLQPAVTAPENVGVVDKTLNPLQKRNLGEVAKVLGQIASGKPFRDENVYLQPLNAFVGESTERLARITGRLISVPDAERTFDIDEFNDLYAKNKPTLYIKMSDVFAIHGLVAAELGYLCPSRDDVLGEIMQDLGSAQNNEHEMEASADLHMFLTPRLRDMDDPEADVKALFMETKRCVLYIIRVQTGANLLEILVKPIGPDDEAKWRGLLRDDFSAGSGTKGPYSDANMVDVTCMSYSELKKTALENVMRLDRMGRISKHNFYQDILNAIALDIRTKSRRRVQRQRELEGVRMTLANLHQKAAYLEQQRKSYDDYIEQAMKTLQNKKGKKRFVLPFTKQYNHQRELERSGRVPKFGSYKYSARHLFDKGVLVSWQGVPERDWGHINLTISCDEVGLFAIEGSKGHIQIPGASAVVGIEDLLEAQFETHQFMNLFEEGGLRLNVNLLLHLLYKKFYGTT